MLEITPKEYIFFSVTIIMNLPECKCIIGILNLEHPSTNSKIFSLLPNNDSTYLFLSQELDSKLFNRLINKIF